MNFEEVKIVKNLSPKAENIDWLLTRYKKATKRFMDAEMFLLKLMELPWWKRAFFSQKMILDFMKNLIKENKEEKK